MRKAAVVVLLLPLWTTGCLAWAWRGYRSPGPGDLQRVVSSAQCVRIGTQNLRDEELRTAVLAAVGDVCRIFADARFRDSVTARTWLANCDRNPDGSDALIPGAAVYRLLADSLADFSVHPRTPAYAVGQTDPRPDPARVAIGPERIRYWYSSDPELRSELVNTVAHEMTHVVSTRFRDKGHGSERCPDGRLVSYGIGGLAARLWLAHPELRSASRSND